MASPDPKERAIRAGSLHPYRQTTITFDVDSSVLEEPFNLIHRDAKDIHPAQVEGLIRLKAGPWILKPIQGRGFAHESITSAPYTVRLSAFLAHSSVVEVPFFRNPSELTDINPDGDVSTTGDYFLTKRVIAGGTWANLLTLGPPLNEEVAGGINYPMDLLVTALAAHDPMTGYLLKLQANIRTLATPDYAYVFEFGGELYGSGYDHSGFGKFQLVISGDGQMVLYERIDNEWKEGGRWRGFDGLDGIQAGILVWIVPAWPKYLQITTELVIEPEQQLIPLLGQITQIAILGSPVDYKNTTFVYETTNRGTQANAAGPGWLAPITGQGQISMWMRRDLRGMFQVNRIGYPDEGFLIDRAFTLRGGVEDAHICRINMHGFNYIPEAGVGQVTEMEGELLEATGPPGEGTALVEAEETFIYAGEEKTFQGWNPPGGENKMLANITLRCLEDEEERVHTPFFTGYTVARNAHIGTSTPGSKTGGTVVAASIMGDAFEPDQTAASFEIQDLENEISFLRARGRATVRVETTFDEAGVDKCVLFEGYVARVTSELRGKVGDVYPSSSWHDLRVECAGKWDRLSDRFFTDIIKFSNDRDSPSGSSGNVTEYWKITDICRFLLSISGVPDDEILIDDLPLRIFQQFNQKDGEGSVVVMPGMSLPEFLQMLLREYLGAWIFFDANAGTKGKWRLMLPPDGTEDPVWAFVNTAPAAGPKLVHLSASYGERTSRILHSLRSYVVRSEGNILYVVGGADPKTGETFRRTVKNDTSWDSPTHTTADDTDLDYWGEAREVYYIDPTLVSQEAVDFIARRVWQVALRGRKFLEFEAEMVLLDVEDEESPAFEEGVYITRKRRPIRPGDLVTVDGTLYIVHQCSPSWDSDHFARAFYECELFREATDWH